MSDYTYRCPQKLYGPSNGNRFLIRSDLNGLTRLLNRVASVSVLILIVLISSEAQTTPPENTTATHGWTPLAQQPGAPAGSYPLSGFDNVNLFNGRLSFRLPLMQIGGRGRAGYTMMLPIEQNWRVETVAVPTCNQSGCSYLESDYKYIANPIWWSGILPGYGPGVLQGRLSGSGTLIVGGCAAPIYVSTLTRLTFTAPDGTEFELRDKQTDGQPLTGGSGCFEGPSRGRIFVTADGSAATFISDNNISDVRQPQPEPNNIIYPSGYLLLRDGTRYRIDGGVTTYIRDTNGNFVRFTFSETQVIGIEDSLNRHVSISYGTPDMITFKGANGVPRTIKIHRALLSTVLRKHPDGSTEYTIKTFAELFALQNGQVGTFDIPVTSAVELPDGRQYQFRYDSYANLAQVILPTGGRIEYDWTTGVYQFGNHVKGIYSRVLQRRTAVNTTTTTYETKSTYTAAVTFDGTQHFTNVTVDTLDATGGVLLGRSKHYFYGDYLPNLSLTGTDYPAWKHGREYQTELYDANGTTVLRRVNNTWQQRAALGWWTGTADNSPPNDTRMVETTTTLVDTNQVSKTSAIDPQTGSVGFDQYNNQTDVWEYDFGTGAAGSLLRRRHTDYLTSMYDTLQPNSSTPDINLTTHIRTLPVRVSVYDAASVERARSTVEYDNYVLDGSGCQSSFHCPLKLRSNISGLCAAVVPGSPTQCDNSNPSGLARRGNATASTQYLLSNGSVTGSISTYNHYDIAGNVVRTIDPRSTLSNVIATTIEYDDRFGGPDGEARSNSAPAELNGLSTFGFPTKLVNPLGHESYAQRDYYLGQPVDLEDSNGVVSSSYFEDLLERPTKIVIASNQSGSNSPKAQTLFVYDDANRTITTLRDLHVFQGPNAIREEMLYDGLGRTIETRQYENSSQYIAVRQIPFIVLQDQSTWRRASQTSNPFRPYLGEQPIWATTFLDSLDRTIAVKTPDNAVVRTAYSGSRVLVSDQASKKRMSKTNALGQLTDVWEVTPADSATEVLSFPGYGDVTAGYRTAYEYDSLDNLTKVIQGSQQSRVFLYDSIKRLTSATNPESGTTNYQYDQSNNLKVKTDARGVSTHFDYDSLNRLTRRWYNGSNLVTATTHNSPALPSGVGASDQVNFYYDTQSLPSGAPSYARGAAIGRLVAQTYGVGSSTGDYFAYDVLGRPTLKIQRTGSINYQMSAVYKLSGALNSLTYPSGHTVTNLYDMAGRLTDFSGNLGDGTNRNYSTEILYSPLGGPVKEKFGTNTAIYNKLFYNSRGQLAEIRESTSYTGPSDTSWDRGALINNYSDQCTGVCSGSSMPDNNGNLKKQEIRIPNQQMRWQQYDYDSLNRLNWAREVLDGGAEQWKQVFTYDRWGNRTINTATTYGIGINNTSFEKQDATNRLYAPGDLALPDTTRRMRYDFAGNLTNDTYTGAGNRTYDAENKITSAWGGNNQAQLYKYDASGQRIKRTVDGVETWQVYGFGGELLAEYPDNGAVASPQKEYGYRNGQLLVTAEPSTAGPVNVALAANGAVATASSAYNPAICGSSAVAANDGDRTGRARCNNHVWNDAAPANTFPDWLQIDFNGSKTITEINVITIQDHLEWPVEPTESMTFSLYGLSSYQVQYWNNSTWVTIPGGSVSGNNKVWRKFTFAAITTSKIRVLASASADGYSRIVELEAWTGPSPTPRYDLALGATATASTSYPGWGPSAVVNGDRKSLNAYSDGAWSSAAAGFPQWVQVDFGANKTINEIHIFTLQDNWAGSTEPTPAMTFTLYGLTGYEVQYWNGSGWVTVPGGSVTGNNKIWRTFTFSPISTSKIRVLTNAAPDGVSRVTEIEAYGPADTAGSGNGVQWLVTDHLGTPRMIFDQTGSLANVKRHDYLPFGEELFAPTGGRTTAQGYSVGDGVRQKFTLKERDNETGLDYFLARYYSSTQGRFTSPDEFSGGPEELFDFSADAADNPTFYADLTQPQSLNKYQYCLNSPLVYLDPNGHQQALTQRIMLEQGYLGNLSKSIGAAYDRATNAAINAKNQIVGFRAKVQKALGTDRDSLIEKNMGGPFALPRDRAELVADQAIAFNDGLLMGPTKALKFEQAAERALVSQGYKVTRGGEGMADFLAVAANKSHGIVQEVTTSASKSLSTIRTQLAKGFDELASQGQKNIQLQVKVNSQRAAARLRKELGKVRDTVVEIIVAP